MRKKGIEIEKIVDLHNQGLSPIEISEKLNCSIANISKRLSKLGIKPSRKKNDNWNRTNRYKIDLTYFESINTSEKAYILGLLYADGSVAKSGFYIKMKDEDILLKVKKELKAEQPIRKRYYNNKYWAYVFTVHSEELSRDLVKQGCFINKTYTLSFPDIDKSFYSHFLRGFFDGDGCLQINSNYTQCRFDLTSASVKLLEDIQKILSGLVKTKGSLRKENGKSNAWHLRYSGFRINMILDWLYQDATIFMKRKHDKFLIYKSVHVKQGELLENPEEDNQQPSLSSNTLEGSTTNSRVQTDNAEDSDANTSALPDVLAYSLMMKVKKRWTKNSVMI